MLSKVRNATWLNGLGPCLVAAALLCAGAGKAAAAEPGNVALVAPGMNQTELQSVMGPPDYIQIKGLRQAWQYCPSRFFIRLLDEVMRDEKELFVTVWLDDGRVKHMRAYPGRMMGQCEDYLAAFRWEDEIGSVEDGGGFFK